MNYLKELLFPRRCPICDNIVSGWNKNICELCYENLKPIQGEICCKCGKKLTVEEKEYCKDCCKNMHIFTGGMALYEYVDVAKSIYRFKYGERAEYAEFYGREMAIHFKKRIQCIKPDALMPVPLHKERQRKRGYNQAELLAKEIGKELGIPVYTKVIVRQKKTLPQKKLNAIERQNNLKKAFKIIKNELKLNTIIIVDDIYTTGSTIDSIARVLKDAGVHEIYYMALAIGKE